MVAVRVHGTRERTAVRFLGTRILAYASTSADTTAAHLQIASPQASHQGVDQHARVAKVRRAGATATRTGLWRAIGQRIVVAWHEEHDRLLERKQRDAADRPHSRVDCECRCTSCCCLSVARPKPLG